MIDNLLAMENEKPGKDDDGSTNNNVGIGIIIEKYNAENNTP